MLDNFSLERLVLITPPILLALTVHEFAHAWSAYKLGDPTAKNEGRLTLNPLHHMDPIGTFAIFITAMVGFGIGWARPVPVNPYNFKHMDRDDLLVSIAGPASNMLQAIVMGVAVRVCLWLGLAVNSPLVMMLFAGLTINLALAIFNMLPIFPLDGSHILRALVPSRYKIMLDESRRYAPLLLLFLIFTPILGYIISPFIFRFSVLFLGSDQLFRSLAYYFYQM
ncbi:MAG: site-2 protease family protein [Gemmatimonadetes bacterium]|nr:MAG: site-2 protease family protein [Gemmatimonadota bacterium]